MATPQEPALSLPRLRTHAKVPKSPTIPTGTWIPRNAAAEILQVSDQTIANWEGRGLIASKRIPWRGRLAAFVLTADILSELAKRLERSPENIFAGPRLDFGQASDLEDSKARCPTCERSHEQRLADEESHPSNPVCVTCCLPLPPESKDQ